MAVKCVTGLLTHRPAHFERYARTDEGKVVLDLASLDEVPDDDLLELAATLMTYHLRHAGRLEAVSRETAALPSDPLVRPQEGHGTIPAHVSTREPRP